MIQDIAPKKFYNQYKNIECNEDDRILVYRGRDVLLKKDSDTNTFTIPLYREVKAIKSVADNEKVEKDKNAAKQNEDIIYLFAIDDTKYFLLNNQKIDADEEKGWHYATVNETRQMLKKEDAMATATGLHLNTWYSVNRYCGRCGTKTVHDKVQRMLYCPECKNMIFPRIAPAVIVALTHNDKIMLTKYAGREYTKYALIAGFNEIGETIEETVKREVMEEVGMHVKNIRYYKSQPWGISGDLLMGFFAELDEELSDGTINLDEEELSLAEWKTREEVPDYKEGLSLTHEMMMVFKNQQ